MLPSREKLEVARKCL